MPINPTSRFHAQKLADRIKASQYPVAYRHPDIRCLYLNIVIQFAGRISAIKDEIYETKKNKNHG